MRLTCLTPHVNIYQERMPQTHIKIDLTVAQETRDQHHFCMQAVLTPHQTLIFPLGIQWGSWHQCNYKRFNPAKLMVTGPSARDPHEGWGAILGLPAPCIWREALEILPIAQEELPQHSSTYHVTSLAEAKDLSTPRPRAHHLLLAELPRPTHLWEVQSQTA